MKGREERQGSGKERVSATTRQEGGATHTFFLSLPRQAREKNNKVMPELPCVALFLMTHLVISWHLGTTRQELMYLYDVRCNARKILRSVLRVRLIPKLCGRKRERKTNASVKQVEESGYIYVM